MRWKLGGMWIVRQILFLPLEIFDSYVSLIQNNFYFGAIRRISNLTNLAVTSWAFSWFLSPGLYGRLHKVFQNFAVPWKIHLDKNLILSSDAS